MRLLIDASLSPGVARALEEAGHDAVHVGASVRLDAADADFGEILARQGSAKSSVILFRRRTRRRPAEQAGMIVMHLPDVEQDLQRGAIVVVEESRIRVRLLPLADH